MFLKRFQLSNVRSLRALEIDFTSSPPTKSAKAVRRTRQWTVVLGENGLGKSTLLKSIALVTAGSEALPALLADPDSWINVKAKEAVLEADVETAEGEPRHARLVIRRGRGIRQILADNAKGLKEFDRAFEYSPRSYFVVGYGVSRRLPRGERQVIASRREGRSPRASSVATLFDPDVSLNPLETWAMDLHYREGDSALKVIRETLDRTLPHIKFHSVDKKKRRLLFETPDGIIPFTSLSDGYQNVAGWLGDLVFSVTETFKDFKNPLGTRGLVLIDEIDLHLHPAWQRRLREFLTERLPNFQIIATTHSALTAHQTRAGELHYLRRIKDRPVLERFDGDASHLALTQLIASPIFGLDTLDSLEVQKKKTAYRELRESVKRRSGKRVRQQTPEKAQLKTLAQEIKDIPNPLMPTTQEQDLQNVLTAIHQELATLKKSKP